MFIVLDVSGKYMSTRVYFIIETLNTRSVLKQESMFSKLRHNLACVLLFFIYQVSSRLPWH